MGRNDEEVAERGESGFLEVVLALDDVPRKGIDVHKLFDPSEAAKEEPLVPFERPPDEVEASYLVRIVEASLEDSSFRCVLATDHDGRLEVVLLFHDGGSQVAALDGSGTDRRAELDEATARRADRSTTVVFLRGHGGLETNRVLLVNLKDISTGGALRKERRVRDAQRSADQFAAALLELLRLKDKQRVRCNIEKVPSLTIGPQLEPTEVVIKTQTGWVEKAGRATSIGEPETITREEFYAQHRLQRTMFDVAKEITDKLALKRQDLSRLLFPQILRIVEGYIDKRVRLSSPQARKEEIALKKYRDPIVSQLLDAIEPDVEQGERALLPRIERHRPTGSTAQVQFRTTKKTKQTEKSHISHVVLDSNWEGGAQHHLEQCRRVTAYAKNDRLDFEVFYEWEGATHKYIPDYLIRILDERERETNLILEIKGLETQQDRAKRAAADKWVRAVNNLPDRPYGTWDYVVCKNPNQLRATLDEYRAPLGQR